MNDFTEQGSSTHPILVKAQKEDMESQLAELEGSVKEYEKLRSGKYKVLKESTFEDLPIELIRARIALGLTQKQLAELVGIKEQQIQRYEAERYSSASLRKLVQISKALEINISDVNE